MEKWAVSAETQKLASGRNHYAQGAIHDLAWRHVNGGTSVHTIPSHMTLAELIRDRLGLMGTKIACDQARQTKFS